MGNLTLTLFGATAVTFMMLMYALERRGNGFVLAFAAGCALSSTYGFLVGAWPFGIVEAIWALVATRRYFDRDPERRQLRRRPTAPWSTKTRAPPLHNSMSAATNRNTCAGGQANLARVADKRQLPNEISAK